MLCGCEQNHTEEGTCRKLTVNLCQGETQARAMK